MAMAGLDVVEKIDRFVEEPEAAEAGGGEEGDEQQGSHRAVDCWGVPAPSPNLFRLPVRPVIIPQLIYLQRINFLFTQIQKPPNAENRVILTRCGGQNNPVS
ncbi:hypothetical protein GCM10027345_16070 [Hymenobacter daeguensis]